MVDPTLSDANVFFDVLEDFDQVGATLEVADNGENLALSEDRQPTPPEAGTSFKSDSESSPLFGIQRIRGRGETGRGRGRGGGGGGGNPRPVPPSQRVLRSGGARPSKTAKTDPGKTRRVARALESLRSNTPCCGNAKDKISILDIAVRFITFMERRFIQSNR